MRCGGVAAQSPRCAGREGHVGLLLGQLARLDDGARGAALGVLQQLGAHRFTVHDTRSFLAALPALEAAIGRGGPEGEHAAERARELLELLCSITRLGSEPTATPTAYWDMGVGVMGATGFDLPAERVVSLAAKGGFTLCAWVRLEQASQPAAVFGVSDGAGAGMQLQLHRAGAGHMRAQLLVEAAAAAAAAAARSRAPSARAPLWAQGVVERRRRRRRDAAGGGRRDASGV